MAKASFTPPTHWEDWIGALLALWLLASPMVIQYGELLAAQNAVVVGFLLLFIEFIEVTAFREWEEWINVVLGAWLVASPWVLGSVVVATANVVIVGLLVLALALYEIWDEHRHLPHAA